MLPRYDNSGNLIFLEVSEPAIVEKASIIAGVALLPLVEVTDFSDFNLVYLHVSIHVANSNDRDIYLKAHVSLPLRIDSGEVSSFFSFLIKKADLDGPP